MFSVGPLLVAQGPIVEIVVGVEFGPLAAGIRTVIQALVGRIAVPPPRCFVPGLAIPLAGDCRFVRIGPSAGPVIAAIFSVPPPSSPTAAAATATTGLAALLIAAARVRAAIDRRPVGVPWLVVLPSRRRDTPGTIGLSDRSARLLAVRSPRRVDPLSPESRGWLAA